MKIFTSVIREFKGEPVLVLPDEIRKEMAIRSGDLVDITLSKDKRRVEIRFLSKKT